MNWLDYAILAVIVVSTIAGLWRGFTREVFSLLTWVAAFWLAWMWGPALAPHLGHLGARLDNSGIRLYLAYAAVFIAVLVIGSLLSAIFVKLVHSTILIRPDRSLGGCAGFVRGLFIVVAVIMIANVHGDARAPMWRQSLIVPQLLPMASQLRQWVPGAWLVPLKKSASGSSASTSNGI